MSNFATVNDVDRVAVMRGIITLTGIGHISYMSRSMLCSQSGVKDTKLRATLQDLVDKEMIKQCRVTQTKRPRYFYIVTTKGADFIKKMQPEDENDSDQEAKEV